MATARAVQEFVTRVRRTIDERGLLSGGERVVVAVSGGPDSLALLHALNRLAPDYKLTLHVAHFDHRLREGSDADARFVVRHARGLGIPVTAGVADSIERLRGRSPEEAARIRRSRFLHEVAREVGAARIATGHTLDDQAETVVMNAFAGAGRRGLSGIPPRRWWYVRPLIDVRRSDVEAFCRALRLRPRHDPTNDTDDFLRNVVRHRVLPMLAGTLDVRLPESLARAADVLRDEDYYLDDAAAEAAGVEGDSDGGRVRVDRLREIPPALQRRTVRLLARAGNVNLSAEQTEAVRALALDGRTGARLDLPGRLSALVEYGFLVVGPSPSPPAPRAAVGLEVPGRTDLSAWGLHARAVIGEDRPERWPDGRVTCVLDADRVSFPLRVRRWHSGDRFRPFGMARSKKVGDFFTDEKVPGSRRAQVPLVVDSQGSILWIVGHRMDDRAKVTGQTRRFLWLSVKED